MRQRYHYKFIILPLFLFAIVTKVCALEQINGDIVIACDQSKNKQDLSCHYRTRNAEPVLSITAEYANISLSVKERENYPKAGAITAILFLIDTSDPARQNTIDKNIEHINKLLSSAKDYHRFGLASFDKELRLEAPIGSGVPVINDAAKKLKAIGSTTELYRNMLEAITLFRDIDATRKAIFLFSDGLAEDKAYFHNDVVNAARKAGIVITSIGYPRSISQSVSLQTLRRLSEETGGLFLEANNSLNIPENFFSQAFSSLDNGGEFNVSLSNIINKRVNNESDITLILGTDIGTSKISVHVEFSSVPVIQTPTTIIQQVPVYEDNKRKTNAPIVTPTQIVQQIQGSNSFETWLWYVIPIALLILMILTVTTFFMMLRRQNKHQGNTINYPEVKPFAFLVTQDETKARHPITRTTCRIGRSKNNEITLRDSSVSRRHAEIHRDQGDVFTLIDLNSLNGVFVNNEKIGRYKLQEGDIMEIGDINLRFTLMPTDYQFEESTVMQDTKIPSVH
ncbi:MAG: hypothetical protein ACI9ZT_001851 [Gammaproteobacteria bacterium]|jgi:hypothetical protein